MTQIVYDALEPVRLELLEVAKTLRFDNNQAYYFARPDVIERIRLATEGAKSINRYQGKSGSRRKNRKQRRRL